MPTAIHADDLEIIRKFEVLVNATIVERVDQPRRYRYYSLNDKGRVCGLGLGSFGLMDIGEIFLLLKELPSLVELKLNGNPFNDIQLLAGLSELKSLDIGGCPRIEDIRPLADLAQLEELRMHDTRVRDISPLMHLGGLIKVGLSDRVVDLEPLRKLSLLRELALELNDDIDLRPLSVLTSLERLDITGTLIDLSLLEGLTRIKKLNVSSMGFDNPGSLSRLTALKVLDLDWSGITDLEPLSQLTALEELTLTATAVENIGPLAGLIQLRQLSLDDTSLTDASPLAGLINLELLRLGGTTVANPGFLRRLTKLKELQLGAGISDLSLLPTLADLESLDLETSKADHPEVLGECRNLISLGITSADFADFSFLSSLSRLDDLSLDQTGIEDLRLVASLNKLMDLNIAETGVTDLGPVAGLINLQRINCQKTGVSDLTPLTALRQLRSLDIRRTKVRDLIPLAGLENLHTLTIESTKVKDILPLANLKKLQSINLTDTRVTDLSPLKELKRIANLNCQSTPIMSMAPLTGLTNLQMLYLGAESPIPFCPFPALKKLNTLGLTNIQLTDILQLEDLTMLRELYINQSNLKEFDEAIFDRLPYLESLQLQDNPGLNIPAAITELDDCLDDLKSYCKDRKAGIIPAYETKVILVGNGRVGKTCVVKRWLDNTFNPDEPSTHAIQLRKWLLPDLAKQQGMEKVQLNIWDFGGQDIYQATHQVFLNSQAIFLLVWDARIEAMPTQEEILPDQSTIKYRNYSLAYWLSYIKTLSKDSPVIVVQTRRGRDGRRNDVLTEDQKKEYNIKGMLAVESSLAVGNGYDALKDTLLEIVIDQIETSCTTIPISWYHIRNELTRLSEQSDPVIRKFPLADFQALCSKEDLDDKSTKTLLQYFHNIGVFFYGKGIFDDQIVLDQQWAIDAVYALFNRTSNFALLHQNGRFVGQDLRQVWQKYPPEEQELFVSFMEECEICFEAEPEREKPFADRIFIAPQLLPGKDDPDIRDYIDVAFDDGGGLYLRYQHRILHAAVIRRFIVRVNQLAPGYRMWREGIIIKTAEGKAMVSADQEENQLTIRLEKPSQLSLLTKIRNELKDITGNRADIQESISLDGKAFVNLRELATYPGENRQIEASNGEWVDTQPLLPFVDLDRKKKFRKKDIRPPVRPEIFLSYAHGGESEVVTDQLYESLKAAGYRMVRDMDDLGYTGIISEFMKKIGMGDFVIVVISDKYLRSDYCMFELYEVYRNSRLDKAETIKKIYPLRIEELNLQDPKVLEGYFDHWNGRKSDWETLWKKMLDNRQVGDPRQYQIVSNIAGNLTMLFDLLADINALTKARLSADNFAEVKKAIELRALG